MFVARVHGSHRKTIAGVGADLTQPNTEHVVPEEELSACSATIWTGPRITQAIFCVTSPKGDSLRKVRRTRQPRRWFTLDARHNHPRIRRIVIAARLFRPLRAAIGLLEIVFLPPVPHALHPPPFSRVAGYFNDKQLIINSNVRFQLVSYLARGMSASHNPSGFEVMPPITQRLYLLD